MAVELRTWDPGAYPVNYGAEGREGKHAKRGDKS